MSRAVFLVVLLFCLPARAFEAGLARLSTADRVPFDTWVWYPTETAETPLALGPFTLSVAREAPPAAGRFPVVLLSHGSGGTPLSHRELAAALARAGHVVVAPVHVGDSAGRLDGRDSGRAYVDRPRQVVLAERAVEKSPLLASHLDPARRLAVGYSAGGYTALVLAGATPDFGRIRTRCAAHPEDRAACGIAGANVPVPAVPAEGLAREPRLSALVVIDPLAVPFDRAGLASVNQRLLLVRPEDDSFMPAGPNAEALAAALPRPPERSTTAGRHFVFVDPCPPSLAAAEPLICSDPPGVDRARIHRDLEAAIVAFFAGAR
jgi:predicted dienelactone hydrolase